MKTRKPWYLSKTIWASVVTFATAAAGLLGYPTGLIDNAALTDTILQAVTAIAGIVAIFGRVYAREVIG